MLGTALNLFFVVWWYCSGEENILPYYIMSSSLVKLATAVCVAFVLVKCKDQATSNKASPASVSEHDQRYYAFKLTAYRDQYGKDKVRQIIDTSWHDVELRVVLRFSPGREDTSSGYSNPFIEVRNMDKPADCSKVESRYDHDADPPIYEKGKTIANYRKRLNFRATIASGRAGEVKIFTFLWYGGKKYPDYGIMQRLQIKQTHVDKRSIYFLTDTQIKLSPDEIKQRFFNAKADRACEQDAAQNSANNPPIEGVWHHAFALPQFKGAGSDKKLVDNNKKIALRLAFTPTKGGGQHVRVIVKDLDKPSSCHAFTRYAQTIDWQAHNDKLYSKRIEITKKFGDSDRYYMITWLLERNKGKEQDETPPSDEHQAHIGYFYLDERAGGPFYEYSPTIYAALSIPALQLDDDAIAKHFPASDPAAGCDTPKPKKH